MLHSDRAIVWWCIVLAGSLVTVVFAWVVGIDAYVASTLLGVSIGLLGIQVVSRSFIDKKGQNNGRR